MDFTVAPPGRPTNQSDPAHRPYQRLNGETHGSHFLSAHAGEHQASYYRPDTARPAPKHPFSAEVDALACVTTSTVLLVCSGLFALERV
jgi:hypothetical protein